MIQFLNISRNIVVNVLDIGIPQYHCGCPRYSRNIMVHVLGIGIPQYYGTSSGYILQYYDTGSGYIPQYYGTGSEYPAILCSVF